MIFFLAMFHLVTITQVLLLKDYGITTEGAAVATVFALIVAKVILLSGPGNSMCIDDKRDEAE